MAFLGGGWSRSKKLRSSNILMEKSCKPFLPLLCRRAVLCLFLLLSPAFCRSQHSVSTKPIGETLTDDGKTIFNDAAAIIVSPLHFTPEEWMLAGGAVGSVILLHGIDADARLLAGRNHSGAADNLFSAARDYGNAGYAIPVVGGVYAVGLLSRRTDIRETGLMLIEALGFAGVTTTVVKSVLGRSRPFIEEGPREYRLFKTDFEHTSMPSGHSTVAFAVSSVLAGRMKNPYATAGLYTAAALTAWSRVYHDEHWFSDTVVGAAVGTAMGLAVVGLHENTGSPLSIKTSPSGIGISYRLK